MLITHYIYSMSFLKAEWRKLAMANYIIDPVILKDYVPAGTQLDSWQGNCYISLVGFMFLNTRLLGVKVPFHVNFEEVNLRFYVVRESENVRKRGVVFIKEIVPKPALSFVANSVYKENYETLPMSHNWEENGETRAVSYHWKKADRWHSIKLNTELNAKPILEGSEIEFIAEHYWGYAHVNERASNEYEVTHPKWEHYPVIDFEIDVDFAMTYGSEFSFLNDLSPTSVLLAEGSEITVENKQSIKA